MILDLKKNKIIVDICLIVLLAGCGKEVNEFPTTESDNEDTLVEVASTSEENFEVSFSDFLEESSQTVSANGDEEISFAEENEKTTFLYTIEGDYTTILDGTYDLIANWDGQNYLNSPYALVGLDEFIFQNDCSVDERLSLIGYTFADINDDGNEELFIGPVDDDSHSISGIWGIYTMVDEKTILVKEGWLRNRVYLLEDNVIYNEWDDGAAHWGINTYTLNPETVDLKNVDCYFYQDVNMDGTDAWFHNTIGSSEYNESTKLDWAYEEELEFLHEYQTKIKNLNFMAFMDYALSK